MKDLDWHNKTVCEKLAKGKKKMADKSGNVTGTGGREKSKKSDLYSYLCWRCSKASRRVRCPGCISVAAVGQPGTVGRSAGMRTGRNMGGGAGENRRGGGREKGQERLQNNLLTELCYL